MYRSGAGETVVDWFGLEGQASLKAGVREGSGGAAARRTGACSGCDVVFECAGSLAALTGAPELAARGSGRGRRRLRSRCRHPCESPSLQRPGAEPARTNSYDRTIARALGVLARFQLEPMGTVEPLSDIAAIYHRHQEGCYVKAQIQP